MALEVGEHIIIPHENGEEHLFEVLYIFKPDNFEHSYVLVSAVGDSEEEEGEVFAFRYDESKDNDEDEIPISVIETDEEWDMVEEVFNTLSFDDEEE